MDAAISITLESPYTDEARLLVGHLWEELDRRYGPNPRAVFRPEQIDVPGLIFVVARLAERPVACGAVLPLAPHVGEIKRMWVEPDVRRQGLAQAVLARLEAEAAARHYHTLRLETGIRQTEAIALYERLGFHAIPCWEPYTNDPISRCYEKRLTVGTEG